MKPLHVAFVWHMHQPYYKDDLTNTYLLPWVRLRCAKDYYKMPALLDAYPKVRATFNLVPSLLAQIEDYGKNESQDLFLGLSRRPAEELTEEEKNFLLRWMRESPRFLRVQQSPRYSELASRRPTDSFTADDLRDLQVWFNLAWCDPAWMESEPRLADLKRKDRDFTEEDKTSLFDAQLENMRRIIPKYRELADRGQAELTFSPFYHPILPLLCHVDSARTASPLLRLPERHFSHREDAERQIEMGIVAFERLLGRRPKGMWPSEMAVGESVVSLAVRAGIDWIISDEEVLGRSFDMTFTRDGEGRLNAPEHLYQPQRIDRESRSLAIVFRDSQLSNMIGFDYQRVAAIDAARDLISRLQRIRHQQGDADFLAVIALDGENAWEFYPRDGHDFLNAVYSELESSKEIVSTTVGDFIRDHPPQRQLHRLHTGSWIGASLDTWVGDPEHNTAWDLLAQTRAWLEDYARQHPQDSQQAATAWRELLITEGSDWFWWFSRRHDSGMDAIWDNQFRLHLRNVYKVMGQRAPARLFQPIIERAPTPERGLPAVSISPNSRDDGEWRQAGYYAVGSGFGALHRPVGVVERAMYGCDAQNFYFRIDASRSAAELQANGTSLWLYLSGAVTNAGEATIELPLRAGAVADLGFDPAYVIRIEPKGEGLSTVTLARVLEERLQASVISQESVLDPFFLKVPLASLDKSSGETLEMALVVSRDGRDVEQIPPTGALGVRVPGVVEEESVPARPLKVLIAAAEIAPFAKTGGVADVTAALSKALRRLGHDVRAVMPRYRHIDPLRMGFTQVERSLPVVLGQRSLEATIFQGVLGDVLVYFVDCPELFDRDVMYGFPDDDARFIFFSKAVVQMLQPIDFVPDVINVHDWHAALIPNLLERLHPDGPLADVATVLTIHNLAFQGSFAPSALSLAGLEEWGLISAGVPELDETVNILARGIHFADSVNTVSERYAQEIQTPEFGEGLDELIRSHAHKLHGILNGIDYELFDPERDPNISHHYTASSPEPKALDKAELRKELGLEAVDRPLAAMVSRFYDVKGLDLVEQALSAILDLDVQLVVHGTGDRRYEDMFQRFAQERPGRVAAVIGFDAGLAQRIYAGADMLWMPSRYEPGGLAQLIALRYGTIPVVRATGGLADTIKDYDPVAGTGNGFTFEAYDAWQFFAAVVRACETYRHPSLWTWLLRRAMTEDVSWTRSAQRYVQLYRGAMVSRAEKRGLPALAD